MAKISLNTLAKTLSEKSGLSAVEAELFIRKMFDVCNQGLDADKQVKMKWLGTFKVQAVKDRESINVNTGERFVIEGRDKLAFTPDNILKEIINKPFAQFETVVVDDDVEFDDIDQKFENDDEIEGTDDEQSPVVDAAIQEKPAAEEAMAEEPAAEEEEVAEEPIAVEPASEKPEEVYRPMGHRMPGVIDFLEESEPQDPSSPVVIIGATLKEGLLKEEVKRQEREKAQQEREKAEREKAEREKAEKEREEQERAELEKAESEKALETSNLSDSNSDSDSISNSNSGSISGSDSNSISDSDSVSDSSDLEPEEASSDYTPEPRSVTCDFVSSDLPSDDKPQIPIKPQVTQESQEPQEQQVKGKILLPRYMVIVACLIVVALIGGMGWIAFNYGKMQAENEQLAQQLNAYQQAPAKKAPEALTQEQLLRKKAIEDSIRMAQASEAVKLAEAKENEKSQNGAEAKDASLPNTSKEAKTAQEAKASVQPDKKEKNLNEESKVSSTQYDSDPRVRTGAYRIVGVAQTVTVGAGMTLEKLSNRYLGPGMECYVEALNGTKSVKEGQKIKIPKLEIKKKKK